jgi:hypothetical protein
MTIGNNVTNSQYLYYDPFGGGGYIGRRGGKNWSGSDAIKVSIPRASYATRPRRAKGASSWTPQRPGSTGTKRLLPPQPYAMTWFEEVRGVREQKMANQPLYSSAAYYPAMGQDESIPVDPRQEYRVIEKLRTKVYGSGFNPAVTTAEGLQTLELIGTSAKRFVSGVGCLVRGDVRGVFRNFRIPTQRKPHTRKVVISFREGRKTFSSAMLELTFGWLPLLSDIEDGAAWLAYALNEQQFGDHPVRAVRNWQEVRVVSPGAGSIGYTKTSVYNLQYIIYGLEKSSIFLPSLATLGSVIWEKTPWSFVADWAIPVGSYLQACRTSADLKGKVVRSLKVSTVLTDFRPRVGYVWGRTLTWDNPSYRCVKFDRTVSDEISPPTPQSGTQFPDLFSSWQRTTAAIGLLIGGSWIPHRLTH